MIIENIEHQKSSLPLKDPFTTALRSVETIDEIILILKTQTEEGLGSAPATLAVTGDDLERISSDIELKIIPAFLNYSLQDYEETFQRLSALDICKSAQTAMDSTVMMLKQAQEAVNHSFIKLMIKLDHNVEENIKRVQLMH